MWKLVELPRARQVADVKQYKIPEERKKHRENLFFMKNVLDANKLVPTNSFFNNLVWHGGNFARNE